eukprot:jgi/Chrzof1/3623/Cz13g02210.t1
MYLRLNFGTDARAVVRLACQVPVRYESRKRLAESRPRVKGQFVKQEVLAAAGLTALAELATANKRARLDVDYVTATGMTDADHMDTAEESS